MKKLLLCLLFVLWLPIVSHATTTVHWYVDPDATGAGDGTSWTDAYTSLSSWEAAKQKDLTASDEVYKVHRRSSSGTADSTGTRINTWTTDAPRYIEVITDPGDRHPGYWDATVSRLTSTDANEPIQIDEDYVRITGLQLSIDRVGGNTDAIIVNGGGGGPTGTDIRISYCIIRATGDMGRYGINIAGGAAGVTCKTWNNIIHDFNSATSREGIYVDDAETILYAYNNTIHNCGQGIRSNTGNVRAKNNNTQDCTGTSWYNGTFHADSTHNISNESVSTIAFGQTWATGTADSDVENHLMDSGNPFGSVQVGSVVEDTDNTDYGYVTVVNDAGDLTLNTDVFSVGSENYAVYTNIFGTVMFEDESSSDFHLSPKDIVAKNNGADLSEDATLPFSDDIDGISRVVEVDIGPDEFIWVGLMPLFYYYNQQQEKNQ